MKKINKLIASTLLCGLVTPTLISCIDEAEPMNGTVTEKQIQKSTLAAEAVVNGLPAYLKNISSSWHVKYGYPAFMRIRDIMTGDYYVLDHDYNQFSIYARNKYAGPGYMVTQYYYDYYYGLVFAANSVVSAVNPDKATPTQLGYLGIGYAFRAFAYLDMAQMFEFLPTKVKDRPEFESGKNVDGNVIKYLTCPIVTNKTTELSSRKNPRVTHEQMFKFIENDLNQAEKYIVNNANNKSNTLPNLAVIYGLKARLYMWNAGYYEEKDINKPDQAKANYENAKKYARMAIDKSGIQPITEKDALSTKTGFNDNSKFMWGIQHDAEDAAVKAIVMGWVSFACNETTFGYAQAGPQNMIARSMYDRISNSDWRKLMWKAPEDSPLKDKVKFISPFYKEKILTYGSVKFRPKDGVPDNYLVSKCVGVPLMRVEEMYFIEAEAAEHLSAGAGIKLLTDFMTKYRNPDYSYKGDNNIDEIVFQKRVELWGEGLSFFDYKRLNMSVIRSYKGSNFNDPQGNFNTTGRPAWMNICLVDLETIYNPATKGFNNIDPTDAYVPEPLNKNAE